MAAACTLVTNKTIVKIYDIEAEANHLDLILSGHNDLIHDICWSWDDNYLITASADGTCKLWNLTQKGSEHTDKNNYWTNDQQFFLANLFHPSFVYGAKFHPIREDGYLYIATICYD